MIYNKDISEDETVHFVTLVEEFDKTRVKIYIDGEFAFVLYKGELHSLGIKQDESVSDTALQEVYDKLLPTRGKKRALNLLQKKNYTEKQLRDKLKDGLYPYEVIDTVLEYVKSYHYIDDLQYSKDYISYYSDYRSRGRIEIDLTRKGIDKNTIEKAYYEVNESTALTDEMVLIEALLKKKHYDKASEDYNQKQKMIAYLYRKGFQMDKIHHALEK